jgi:hypothetical protein
MKRPSQGNALQPFELAAFHAGPLAEALDFDFAKIDRVVVLLRERDWRWNDYFRRHRIAPLMLAYEDMVANFELRGVLKFLGLPHEGVAVPEPDLERQADKRSLEWEHRYCEEKASQAKTIMGAGSVRAGEQGPGAVGANTGAQATPAPEIDTEGPRDGVTADLWAWAAPDPLRPRRSRRVATLAGNATGLACAILVAAPATRPWMDATPNRAAYHSRPLLIANQSGWPALCLHPLSAIWDGGDGVEAVRLEVADGDPLCVGASPLGCGVINSRLAYPFRLPQGRALQIRDPVNWPIDGVYGLETIVEGRTEVLLVICCKLTRPSHQIVFEEGEPIAIGAAVRHARR